MMRRMSMGAEIDRVTEGILGAAFETSSTLGHGFLEAVYRKALVHELTLRGVSVEEEKRFDLTYKGAPIGHYVCDLLADGLVIVELKALDQLAQSHMAQLLNHLKASGLKVGLHLNFGRPKLEYRRVLR